MSALKFRIRGFADIVLPAASTFNSCGAADTVLCALCWFGPDAAWCGFACGGGFGTIRGGGTTGCVFSGLTFANCGAIMFIFGGKPGGGPGGSLGANCGGSGTLDGGTAGFNVAAVTGCPALKNIFCCGSAGLKLSAIGAEIVLISSRNLSTFTSSWKRIVLVFDGSSSSSPSDSLDKVGGGQHGTPGHFFNEA